MRRKYNEFSLLTRSRSIKVLFEMEGPNQPNIKFPKGTFLIKKTLRKDSDRDAEIPKNDIIEVVLYTGVAT